MHVRVGENGRAAPVTAQWALGPSARAVRRLDAIAALIVVVFVTLGVLLNAATALDQVGRSLAAIARVPFVGASIGPLTNSVQQTAASIRTDAASAVAGVHALAVRRLPRPVAARPSADLAGRPRQRVAGKETGPAAARAGRCASTPYRRETAPGTNAARIVLTGLRVPIRVGFSYPVIFIFEEAGELRLDLPVENPDAPHC